MWAAWAMIASPGGSKMTGDFHINGAAGEIGALVRVLAFNMDVYEY
jgi:hypothetical protein